MLSIDRGRDQIAEYQPSILPCRINHSGAVPLDRRVWNPTRDDQGTQTAYFRGRKLLGKRSDLPKGYTGVVLKKTDKILSDTSLKDQAIAELESRRNDLLPDEYSEELEELRAASARGELTSQITQTESIGTFDHITVWSHDAMPLDDENPYARAMDEYLAFSNALHETRSSS